MMDLNTLRAWAQELGFSNAGLCAADTFVRERQKVESEEVLKERRQLRFDPTSDDSRIRSLAVLLWGYAPAEDVQGDRVFIDRYYEASNAAYHAARRLEERILNAGHFAMANVAYPAKAAAVRAGLGVIGQNSLLITPEYGTRVVIILMATDITPAASAASNEHAGCLKCGRCAQVCPSKALDESGMRHPQRCLRNYMMEGMTVPPDLRACMDMKLIGCDACQRVCPMQPLTVQNPPQQIFALSDFLTEDDAAFSASVSRLAQYIGRNAARPQRVRAQAALLAGNSKDAAHLPVLKLWAQSPFEAVRQHANWAIREIEGSMKSADNP